jgi:hypothetical protein
MMVLLMFGRGVEKVMDIVVSRNRKIVILVFGLFLSMILSGCSAVKGEWPSQAERKEIILARLEEKYGEKFVIEFFAGPTMFQQWDTVYVYPENGSRELDLFAVKGVIEEKPFDKDIYITKDGYFGILIRPQVLGLLNEIVGECYEEFYIEIWPNLELAIYTERYNRETALSELMYRDGDDGVYEPQILITISETFLAGEKPSEALIKIGKRINDNAIPCRSIGLYVISDEKYEDYLIEVKKIKNKSMYILRQEEGYNVVTSFNENRELYGAFDENGNYHYVLWGNMDVNGWNVREKAH